MDDSIFGELGKPIDKLRNIWESLFFTKSMRMIFHQVFQSAFISKLLNNVNIVLSFMNFVKLDNIGRFQILHNFDFPNYRIFCILVVND